MEKFITISGCSGGGKSTLLSELNRRGYPVVEEPGRRIAAQQLQNGGRDIALVDGAAFARRAIQLALADRAAVGAPSTWVFF